MFNATGKSNSERIIEFAKKILELALKGPKLLHWKDWWALIALLINIWVCLAFRAFTVTLITGNHPGCVHCHTSTIGALEQGSVGHEQHGTAAENIRVGSLSRLRHLSVFRTTSFKTKPPQLFLHVKLLKSSSWSCHMVLMHNEHHSLSLH